MCVCVCVCVSHVLSCMGLIHRTHTTQYMHSASVYLACAKYVEGTCTYEKGTECVCVCVCHRRNSKAVAAQDLTLPPRTLRNALLTFHPAERAFYQVCHSMKMQYWP